MLPIVQRRALIRLARLQEQGVTTTADRPRFGAEHASELELPIAHRTCGHRHRPVHKSHLIAPACTSLPVVLENADTMQHQGPVAHHFVRGMHWRGVRKPGCARAGPALWNPQWSGPHGHRVLHVHLRLERQRSDADDQHEHAADRAAEWVPHV